MALGRVAVWRCVCGGHMMGGEGAHDGSCGLGGRAGRGRPVPVSGGTHFSGSFSGRSSGSYFGSFSGDFSGSFWEAS